MDWPVAAVIVTGMLGVAGTLMSKYISIGGGSSIRQNDFQRLTDIEKDLSAMNILTGEMKQDITEIRESITRLHERMDLILK